MLRVWSILGSLVGVVVLGLLTSAAALAATDTWTGGGGDNNWSTAANWSAGTPNPGDDLVFPSGAARLTNNNDLAPSTAVNSLTFSGSDYSVSGNALQLGAGLTATNATGLNVFGPNLTLTAAQSFTDGGASSTLTLQGAIDLNGYALTVASTGTTQLQGVLGNGGATVAGLTKSGTGTLVLSASNLYDGVTTLAAGTLQISNGSALGSTSAGTIVSSGATLLIDGGSVGLTVAEPLTLNGTGVGGAGALQSGSAASYTWSGPITLASDSSIAVNAALGSLTLSGIINGAGAFTKVGAGALGLTGSNTYTGATTVGGGRLVISNASALGGGGSGTTVSSGAALAVVGGITVAKPLTLNGTGVGGLGALLNGDSAINTWSGPITLASDSSLGVPAGILELTGVMSGSGGLTKVGAQGILELFGSNTYAGATTVSAGTLQAFHNNALGSTAAGTTVQSGATLGIGSTTTALTVAEPLTLNGLGDGGGALLNTSGAPFSLTLSGPITLASDSGINAGAGSLIIAGTISGGGALTTFGFGALALTGSNTYTGATTVASGTLVISNGNALGSTGAGTTVSNGGQLQVRDGITVAEPLTISGVGSSLLDVGTSGATNTWSGPITLASDSTIGVNSVLESLTLSGVISGPGALTKTGSGRLSLSGGSANTYTGTTTVSAGSLVLDKSPGVTAIPGNVTANGGDLSLLASHQIADTAAVTVISATFGLNGSSETIGSLAGSGNMALGAGSLTMGAKNTSTTFSGVISDAGGQMTKVGTGTLTLSGTNTYTGATTVQAGTLLVNGSQPSSPVTVSGGTVGGTGTVGPITATGGTVRPGLSPGILNAGNVALNAGSTLLVELNGATVGTQYDQLNVAGTVSLSTPALNVALGFTPLVGTLFNILNNDGTDAVTGTFAGLPEGAVLTANNNALQVSYVGGTGNDVTLRALGTLTPTATPTLTPTPTVTPTITPTPFPRPNVGVQVTPSAGALLATITARDAGCAQGNNQLQALQVTRLTNATMDVATSPVTSVATPVTVTLSSHPPSIGLTVRRIASGQAATVELIVSDGCGSWPTLVGGGPNGF